MYSFVNKNRSMNGNNIIELANALIQRGWHSESIMSVSKETGPSGACELLAEVLKDTKYRIQSGTSDDGSAIIETYTKQALISKVKALDLAGEYPCMVSGYHRGLAIIIAMAFGVEVEPKVIVCENDLEARTSGNAVTDMVTKLVASDKLPAVIAGIDSGIYKQESHLPFKRGTNQKLWAQARLVKAGVSIDDAVLVGKEDARKAMGSEDPIAHTAKVLEGAEPKQEPIMKISQIREMHDMAVKRKLTHKVAKFLQAIIENNSIVAEGYLLPKGNDTDK